MNTCSGRKGRRLRGDAHSAPPGDGFSIWSNGSLSTLVLMFSLIVLVLVGACSSDRHVDPIALSSPSDDVRLRYQYPMDAEFIYRQSIERIHYGTSTGETHLLQLRCRECTRDVQTFTLIDSLLFTHSGATQFLASQRSVGSFTMTSSGDLPSSGKSLLSAALPPVPLPGLPTEELSMHDTIRQKLPYGHDFPDNARVIRSTRERTLRNAPNSQRAILHEQILQVVEREYPTATDTASVVHPAARTFTVTYDTLAITREIELSGVTGHLVRSIETEREVHFIPDGKGSSVDGLPHGNYAVNESVTRFTLVSSTSP